MTFNKGLILVGSLSSVFAIPGILIVSNILLKDMPASGLIATILILIGIITPFMIPITDETSGVQSDRGKDDYEK